MREILFRGRRRNGEWIEGNYIFWNKKHCIYDGIYYEVLPETIGQYTGLCDKNGKRIFEGDILKIAKVSDSIGMYYFPPLNYPVNVVVTWDMCAWMWETLCEDKRYIGFPEAWCHYECEIIGNIHDNPELLKGGAE